MRYTVLTGFWALLILGCSGNPNPSQQAETASPLLDSSSSVKNMENSALSSSVLPHAEESQSAPDSTALSFTLSSSSTLVQRVPPPHEKWMDTMMSLAGVEPPNQAKMVEEDPYPLNLRSIEILIAHRYKPEKPITLTIRAYVIENGTVSRVQVLRNSQPDMVPSYFLPPLRELRFQPAKENGKPIPTWTTFTLNIQPI